MAPHARAALHAPPSGGYLNSEPTQPQPLLRRLYSSFGQLHFRNRLSELASTTQRRVFTTQATGGSTYSMPMQPQSSYNGNDNTDSLRATSSHLPTAPAPVHESLNTHHTRTCSFDTAGFVDVGLNRESAQPTREALINDHNDIGAENVNPSDVTSTQRRHQTPSWRNFRVPMWGNWATREPGLVLIGITTLILALCVTVLFLVSASPLVWETADDALFFTGMAYLIPPMIWALGTFAAFYRPGKVLYFGSLLCAVVLFFALEHKVEWRNHEHTGFVGVLSISVGFVVGWMLTYTCKVRQAMPVNGDNIV